MFFISRRASKDSYYVMDTDDGVEELLTYTDLIKAVVDKGIKIEGIKIRKTKQGYFKSLDCNVCYTLLKSQPLLRIATGVDIKEVNGYIVGIAINEDNDTRIKLSDYYKGVSFRALDNLEYYIHFPPKAVFIFDDKLDMPLEVLSQSEFIIVDITNLTNDKIAYNFYKYIPANCIEDKPERRIAFILDRVKDPSVLENLGIPKKDIQSKIEKTLKTMDKYFSTVKLVKNNRLDYYICNPKDISGYLKVNEEYLKILGYYIEYGVDDAKDIIYKLINRARDELNLDFRFHSKFIDRLPKLWQI